jgi:hypothetical protein
VRLCDSVCALARTQVTRLGDLLSALCEEEIETMRSTGRLRPPRPGQRLTLEEQRMMSQVEMGSDGSIRPRKLDGPWYKAAAFQDFALDERLTAICRAIFGGRNPLLFADQAFMKPPGGGRKPYHQDNWYFNLRDSDDVITVSRRPLSPSALCHRR